MDGILHIVAHDNNTTHNSLDTEEKQNNEINQNNSSSHPPENGNNNRNHDNVAKTVSLQQNWSPWFKAAQDEIPEISYSGYINLAENSLDPKTKAALKSCSNCESIYHNDPASVIKKSVHYERCVDVYKRIEKALGLVEYKLIANRDIEEKECIDFFGGRLLEAYKAEYEGEKKQQERSSTQQQQQYYLAHI
jgi:hypothetical protein